MEHERLVGLKEAADFLGRKPSWLYNRTRTGKIAFYKTGKYCMFKISELMEWLKSQQGGAAQ